MSAHDAHYAGELVDGARMLALQPFGTTSRPSCSSASTATRDGSSAPTRASSSSRPSSRATTSRRPRSSCGSATRAGRCASRRARSSRTCARAAPPASAADVLGQPVVVCRAVGTCVTPKGDAAAAEGAVHARPPRRARAGAEPIVTPPVSARGGDPHGGDRRRRGHARADAVPAHHARRRSPTRRRAAARRAPRSSTSTCATTTGRHAVARSASQEAIAPIRAKTDCIVQPTTGGAVGMSIDERAQPLACKPEMATLNCGTINFGDDVFVNTRPQIRDLARASARRARRELECYEVGHVEEALQLRRRGDLGAAALPVRARGEGGIGAREDVVQFMRTLVPADATWAVAAVGRHQQPMTELAMRLGGTRASGSRTTSTCRRGCSPRAARRSWRARRRTRGRSGARPSSRIAARAPRVRASERRVTVCTRTLVADTLTPVARLRRACGRPPERASFLLESVVGGERWGRYSILGYRPRYDALARRAAGRWVDANVGSRPRRRRRSARGRASRSSRDRRRRPRRAPRREASRGDVGYLAWDLVHAIEKVPGWSGAITAPRRALLRGRDHRRLRRARRRP
jgi:3-keto-5-aminohexanoate cleavage enzyme